MGVTGRYEAPSSVGGRDLHQGQTVIDEGVVNDPAARKKYRARDGGVAVSQLREVPKDRLPTWREHSSIFERKGFIVSQSTLLSGFDKLIDGH